MGFPEHEKAALRALKGVGDTVIARLEQLGIASLSQLAEEDPTAVTKQISQMMGSTCWHNSPQARAAIADAVELARSTARGGA